MARRKILVAGAGGFIGGHLVNRLTNEDNHVTAVDIKPMSEWFQTNSNSNRIPMMDLSKTKNADLIMSHQYDDVYMLAADMGGMGYIASHKTECMLSVLISAGMIRGALHNHVDRYLYSSSACVYSSYTQQDTNAFLKESDAYPADPEPGYGLEKLFSEELTINVGKETSMETRAPRFHNVYGPYGSYDGGREKAPAAICRKVIQAKLSNDMNISIWGDGEQTRSFMYIDDCVEGVIKLMNSDIKDPINLGSAQLVTINRLVSIAEGIAGVKLKRSYELDKPQGVRGRCSDNTKIREELGWEPSISLEDGMEKTYKWIYDCIVSND